MRLGFAVLAVLIAACQPEADHIAPTPSQSETRTGSLDTTFVSILPLDAEGLVATVTRELRGESWSTPLRWNTYVVSGADTLYHGSVSTADFDDYFDLPEMLGDTPEQRKRSFVLDVARPQSDTLMATGPRRLEIERFFVRVASEHYEELGSGDARSEAEALFAHYGGATMIVTSFADDPVVGAPLHTYDPIRRRLIRIYAG